MSRKTMLPVHPGEILGEEFMRPLGLSQYRLAKSIGVQATRINQILHGRLGISADTALRLARYFNTTPEFWMNAQTHYELELAKDALAHRLAKEVRPHAA